MAKADDLRAMRERKFAPAKPAKTSRGGVESRHAAQHDVDTAQADVSGIRSRAGVAPGPRDEKKPKRGRPRLEDRDKTLAARKPWAALGMSESTWRRRQAEKAKTNG